MQSKKKYISQTTERKTVPHWKNTLIPFAYFEILDKFSDNSKQWMGKLNLKEAKQLIQGYMARNGGASIQISICPYSFH